MDSQFFNSTTPKRQLGQSFISGSASLANIHEPDTKSMQLQLIQQKHLIMKLEKENTTLQQKVSDLISQQFKSQRLIVDQKKQIADFSHNLHFLQQSIVEEDSPVKQVIQKLLNNDQSPKEFDKQLDVEKQIQMNSLQRENQQLKQKLQSVEEKLQNLIQRQFRDAANILKLKKDKSSLVEKLSISEKSSEQIGSANDPPAVQVIISEIYSDVQNVDKVKEKFESLIQNYMVLYLTQQSNSQIELGESVLRSHRSSSSRKVDQIQNLFSEILKFGNIETQRSRESVLATQENQMVESFLQEKPQTVNKSSQTIGEEKNQRQIHSPKKSQTIMTTSRVLPNVEVVNIDLKIEDVEFKQNSFPPSTSSVVLLAAATNIAGESQNNVCEKEDRSKYEKGSNEQGQNQAQVEDLINQLNYTKRQYYYAVDQCLQVKDELGRLKNVDEQLNFLAQQHTNTQKDLERYKVKFETLLNRYFQLEQSQKGQNAD